MDRILDCSALAVVLALATAASGCASSAGAPAPAAARPTSAPVVALADPDVVPLPWLPADATSLIRYPGHTSATVSYIASELGADVPPCFTTLTRKVEVSYDVVRPGSTEPVHVYVGDLPRAPIEACAVALFGATMTRDGATTRFRGPGGKVWVAGWATDRRVLLHSKRDPVVAMLAPTPPRGDGPLVALYPRLHGDGMVVLTSLDVTSASLGVPSSGVELRVIGTGPATIFEAHIMLSSAADAEQARRAAEALDERAGVSPELAELFAALTYAVEGSDLVVDIRSLVGADEVAYELAALLIQGTTGVRGPAPAP